MIINVGTRKSKLAIRQAEIIVEKLQSFFPDDTFNIVGISTLGDIKLEKDLSDFKDKGIFIKELEKALILGEIDMAVHSAKDIPTELDSRFSISAAVCREDASDVFITIKEIDFSKPLVIGTGSQRRMIQAKELCPNAEFKSIRGNINTRIEKLKSGEYDAIIMAKAAINRLEIDDVYVISMPDDFISAAGQGILAVEILAEKMQKYTDKINDINLMKALIAERTFLNAMGGGCSAPCGAYAKVSNNEITMRTFYSQNNNSIRLEMSGTDAILLGEEMAERTKL